MEEINEAVEQFKQELMRLSTRKLTGSVTLRAEINNGGIAALTVEEQTKKKVK